MAHAVRPYFARIEKKLAEALQPVALKIVDESHLHAGHAGNPGGGEDAETHFSVTVVSDAFAGKSLVQRHQLVYKLLKSELEERVHALSLKTKTPAEAPGVV